MKKQPSLYLALVATVLTGCVDSLNDRSQVVDAPPGTTSVVIQGLLDPRATVQTLYIESSVASDSSGDMRPVDPVLVSLRLVGPGGSSTPFQPQGPARFDALIQVLPDSTYRLEGTVGDSTIFATVRVPDSISFQQPPQDTLRIAAQEFHVSFPYSLQADGATLFLLAETSIGTIATLPGKNGVISIFAFQDTFRLRIDAYEPYAGEWVRFTEGPRPSNIRGAYGFLGAFNQSRQLTVIPQ